VVPENRTGSYGIYRLTTEEYGDDDTASRFTADFKARVALKALRGDKTLPEIATKHKVHPNQVSTWKRQAMDSLGAVFSNGADKARVDHEGEIHDLQAKIGQLTAERNFLAKGFKR